MSAAEDQRRQLIEGFQETMTAFLETQRAVMLAFLDGSGLPPETAATVAPEGVEPESQQPPPGQSPAAPSRVEPLPDLSAPPAAPAWAGQSSEGPAGGDLGDPQSFERVVEALLTIVEDRTGYPPETLDLDLRMEADLGMDSIKRVEIIGTLQRRLHPGEAVDAAVMDELTRARTLRALAEGFVGGPAPARTGHAGRDDADQEVDRAGV